MTKEGMQAGTGGLDGDPEAPERIEAPAHGKAEPAVAPHSDGMFDRMHGGPALPDADLEDRLSGTETLELLLDNAVRSGGDEELLAIYAAELAKHYETHGLSGPEMDAMRATVRRRVERTGVRESSRHWREVQAEACRLVVRARVEGRMIALTAALEEIEPKT